ncbi:MAG TPA: type II toxin-antitoxin system VapC family toxin [Acidimicrobiales bacterium]
MGLIVVDTGVLVDNLRRVAAARDAVVQALDRGDRLVASVVSKVELLSGMRATEKRATRDLLAAFRWIDVDDTIAEVAGTLGRRYRSSHHNIGVVDCVIAATATVTGGELWTRNLKRFPMFPKLLPPY